MTEAAPAFIGDDGRRAVSSPSATPLWTPVLLKLLRTRGVAPGLAD